MTASRFVTKQDFQVVLDDRFHNLASYWKDIYSETDLFSLIHKERHARMLAWFLDLGFGPGTSVLDLGCGAGVQAVDLALRGASVDAIDPVEAMVELGRQHAGEEGVSDRARFVVGDAHALPYADNSFDLVIAMGVLPFIFDPAHVLEEVARVTRPGGVFIVSSHNLYRLSEMFDPRRSVFTRPGKELIHRLTRSKFRRTLPVRTFSLPALTRLLAQASFSVESSQSFGYGPFSFMGSPVFSERVGVGLQHRLQRMSDRGAPVVRSTGNQHLVLARLRG